MNKSELVESVLECGYESKAGAERAVDAVLHALTGGLKTDGSVSLIGFGTWTVKQRAGRIGRNPQTGAPISIAPSLTVAFKAGSRLKGDVNR